MPKIKPIRSLMVANRGEIAIRVLRAANELDMRTVAIFSKEDRYALHRSKADESYKIGAGKNPIQAYLDIKGIIKLARQNGVDAIHPGYGFLAENPDFADACKAAKILFIGPDATIMRKFGNKVSARAIATAADVPVMPATPPLPKDPKAISKLAHEIGYPFMLKASWGGGGRGMRVIEDEQMLFSQLDIARREASMAFGNDEVYLEKLVRNARHIEIQILGDQHGNLVHLFERDCSVQRRNQKVVERAPALNFDDKSRAAMTQAALKLGKKVGFFGAGTVEFLRDADTGKFYFIEVNPRIQVEHTVTEVITGLDIVKAQIRIAEGGRLGKINETGIPPQNKIRFNGHALQCRVTTEDPENNFTPDYGRIKAYRSATGFGIRLDGGTAYAGAIITPFYDSMLEKVTAWAPSAEEAVSRMDRALREFRIRGVATNIPFLENLIRHPKFRKGDATTRFIDTDSSLFQFTPQRDRATRLLRFIGEVMVNGNPEVKDRAVPSNVAAATHPQKINLDGTIPNGLRAVFLKLGPEKFAQWIRAQPQVFITDTTMRDAHQSLLATRMRTFDMEQIAPAYSHGLPDLFSVECWGGATFDVAMRFLNEDPWERLEILRNKMPNLLTQMLFRASNAVGYKNYPDNAVQYFVDQAAKNGVDVFRIFDALNVVENMYVAMDAVRATGKICEAALCYTGDLFDTQRQKYDLNYYVKMAKQLEAAGAHILGIKDMAGILKPRAADVLIRTLKQEVSIPIHFHTHDTSGISAATVLSAIDAGVDIIDAAMDSMSGLTSQPSLGSIVEALRYHPRDSGLDRQAIGEISTYWEGVRHFYAGFESDIRSGTSDIYTHEMPGGQYTNLRQQARALGIEEKWPAISEAYATVNRLFGDIVKVTPSSKVVGDMALMMVTSGFSEADITAPKREIAFPDSVVSFFRGDLGRPMGGFPKALQKKVLKGEKPISGRPGAMLTSVDFTKMRAELHAETTLAPTDQDVASYLMYPQLFLDYHAFQTRYGNVSRLPTPIYFYGMAPNSEVGIEIEKGKTLIIRYLTTADEVDKDGFRSVFFELNGEARVIRVKDNASASDHLTLPKADPTNPAHIGAPMPGMIVAIPVQVGQTVEAGATLLSIEAMKMETTIHAEHAGRIEAIEVSVGMTIHSQDLVMVITPS